MRAELVFIPSPGAGHLTSTLEIAKLLVDRDDRLSITVLIIPSRHETAADSLQSSPSAASHSRNRLRFTILPRPDLDSAPPALLSYMEAFKPQVRDAVSKLAESTRTDESPSRLAGFVVDMFCVGMIDVANEFSLPTYMFYTSNAGFLGLQLHVQHLHDNENFVVAELKDSDAELDVPCFSHPFPAKCLPSVMLSAKWIEFILYHGRRFRETKGILVNTFAELEPFALESLCKENSNFPPVYPVGPLLKLKSGGGEEDEEESKGDSDGGGQKKSEIMKWLDGQPSSSVVFLCFGSMGGFSEEQVQEMARGIERSGHRFLWSVRRSSAPVAGNAFTPPGEFPNIEDALPEGFLDRTAEIGKIIGWAPQVEVLAHPSVGGFVSHCGWNSTLESLWFGVPMATLPLYAEQQVNAFAMVVELGLAVEIRKDYRNDPMIGIAETVTAEEMELGIRKLMDPENEVRKRVEEMSRKCHVALMDGGSASDALGRFIRDALSNIP